MIKKSEDRKQKEYDQGKHGMNSYDGPMRIGIEEWRVKYQDRKK